MKAHHLLKRNIDALLTARKQKRRELAAWCRRSESWLSQIFIDEERNIPLKYLDRIADFFGIATYQLFQPGISPLLERRKGERRKMADRRISRLVDVLRAMPKMPDLDAKLRALDADNYRKVARWIEATLLAQDHPQDAPAPDGPQKTAEPPALPTPRTRARR